jgi:hypothetical protein
MLHDLLDYTSRDFFCMDILVGSISNQTYLSILEENSWFLLVTLEVGWEKPSP